ncbi:MAG: ATP phosphoribosyltransferase [Epulopiscium sp.]|nr:ATP phosphoribosyltransferase [Candidatus Epulonipiscium sp.]
MEYLTFALTKGRLVEPTMQLLENAGFTCSEMKIKSRKLIFINEKQKLKFFLAKASDVPTYVEYGVADIGVVGKDILLEKKRNLYELLNLKLGICKMAIAGPISMKEKLNQGFPLRVATKYPNIATDYFYHKRKQNVEIIKLNGSVELAPIVGLSDVIVDIVETGKTLEENGLVVLDEIIPISARMVINRVSMKMEHERIQDLIDKVRQQL